MGNKLTVPRSFSGQPIKSPGFRERTKVKQPPTPVVVQGGIIQTISMTLAIVNNLLGDFKSKL